MLENDFDTLDVDVDFGTKLVTVTDADSGTKSEVFEGKFMLLDSDLVMTEGIVDTTETAAIDTVAMEFVPSVISIRVSLLLSDDDGDNLLGPCDIM